jgi:1-acyl-sn-glycerol-3-phosphate acyltransferase
MSKKNIEKFDFFYLLLRKYVDFWHNYIYYRKVIVYGKDRIDFSVPTIYAPNHQNALMDALAVLCTLKKQPIFLARADIFRKKILARILYRFKMLPVFRMRDGFENLKQNDETFTDTLRVMESRSGLVILPEGNHAGYRRLRQLKKGICRIAFQTAEASNFTKEINIVPVGLEFTHYWLFREVLTVVYGHPIAVSEYYDTYKENPNKGLLDLRDRLSSEMKKVMVHISDENNYEAINELRSIVNEKYNDSIRYPKLFRDTRLVGKINQLRDTDPQLYGEICNDSLTIRDLTQQLHLTYRLLRKKKHPFGWLMLSSLFLLVTMPVFILGAALNFIMFKVPALQSRKVKDEAFISTIRYGMTVALSFFIFPLYLVLALIFIKPWWIALAAFLAIPVMGLLAWNWLMLYRRTAGGFRVRTLMAVNNPAFIRLRDTYNSLTERIARL